MAKYLTIKEIADECGLSPKTILRFVERGELQAVRLGHLYKVKREVWEKFQSDRETVAIQAASN